MPEQFGASLSLQHQKENLSSLDLKLAIPVLVMNIESFDESYVECKKLYVSVQETNFLKEQCLSAKRNLLYAQDKYGNEF